MQTFSAKNQTMHILTLQAIWSVSVQRTHFLRCSYKQPQTIRKQMVGLYANKTLFLNRPLALRFSFAHPCFKTSFELQNRPCPRFCTFLYSLCTFYLFYLDPISKIFVCYHLISVSMANIKKYTNDKCWRVCREKGTLLHSWWECKLVQSLQRIVWKFLKKLKIELPYDSAIPLPGIYLEKNLIRKDTYTPMFTEALFAIAKSWKQPVSFDRNG